VIHGDSFRRCSCRSSCIIGEPRSGLQSGNNPKTIPRMSRKPVPRSLPPLAEMQVAFAGFAPAEHKAHRLTMLLRQTARQLVRREAQAFYAMPEVARFFHVSLETVSWAYRQLEREGLLLRQRGA